MTLFEFLDRLRAEADYPGTSIVASFEHIPDPTILPDDVYTKEDPKPTEDTRGDAILWSVTVSEAKSPTFSVTTDHALNVLDVEANGPEASYVEILRGVLDTAGVV